MRKRFFIAYSFLCFFFVSEVKALAVSPIDTTIKHDVTKYYTESMLIPFNIWQKEAYSVDTTLANMEIYTTHYSLGNTGLPYVPVVFNSTPTPLGFYYGEDYLSEYFKNDTSIRYYHTRAPYLNFLYVTDPEIHQFLDLVLTQNITKKLNIAIGFHRIRSEGNYLNQSTNLNQVTLAINYRTRRYMLLFDGLYNIYKVDQNGGILGDSNFINPNYTGDRTTVPVNLANARTIQMQTSLRLQQFYFFGYKKEDTAKEKPLFYVSNATRMAWHSNIYTDPTLVDDSAGFYPHYYQNNVNTYDSLQYTQFSSGFNIGTAKGWHGGLNWEFGIEDQNVHFSDYISDLVFRYGTTDTAVNYKYRDTAFNYLMAHALIYNTFFNGHLLFDARVAEIFSGSQNGDIQSSAHIGFKLDSLRLIKITGQYSKQTPSFIYDLYDGNDLEWQNHFNKITTTNASLLYTDAKWHFSLGGEMTTVTNMTYFNAASLPSQTDTAVTVLKAYIEKNFKLGKWHLNTKDIYQQATANSPVHIPTWVTENSLFYENYLFKHHMLFKIGVDVYWNPTYYVYAYQPVVDQYYIQNQVKYGNYVYFDPFIAFRIKTFRMFLKMENVTSDLLQDKWFYGYALHYAMPDRVLRFGINWDFWN